MDFTPATHWTQSEHTLFCQVKMSVWQLDLISYFRACYDLTPFLLAYLLVKLGTGSARVRRAIRNSPGIPWGRLSDFLPQPAAQRPFLYPEIDLPLSLCLSPLTIKKKGSWLCRKGWQHQLAPGVQKLESQAAQIKAIQTASGAMSLAPCWNHLVFKDKICDLNTTHNTVKLPVTTGGTQNPLLLILAS